MIFKSSQILFCLIIFLNMLSQLTIHNFGLIDKITIEFDEHLNILTGETGAGKSILIDALRSALGERIDSSSIRNPHEPCLIEAIFEITDKKLRSNETIAEFLSPDDSNLIIQRTHTSEGKSKIKINGLSITVGQLKALGNHLIDFHGAHDHQMLLSEDKHLGILDQLVDFKNMTNEYSITYHAYADTQRQLRHLADIAQTRARDLDLLTHQVKELEALPLSEEKFEEIKQEQTKVNNAEKLHEHILSLLEFLDNEDAGATALLRKAFSPLKSLTQIDSKSTTLLDQLANIQEQTNELVSQLSDYAQSLDFDPKSAQEINDKFDTYTDIKHKYGPSLNDAQKFYLTSKEKLDLIKNFEHNEGELRNTLSTQEKELIKIAAKITKARQKSSEELNGTIESELKELGINHVKFEVRFEKIPFEASGQDKIAFYISPNAGEELKPLTQIVSSGEAARVMLALKKALIKVDPIPVLIFDEIDAQIGGRLGTITGKKLKELSGNRQVILITHLPQIASFADQHLKVIKTVKSGRATTDILVLDNKMRVEEIAQMMSGASTSKIAISHAEDMLASAQKS